MSGLNTQTNSTDPRRRKWEVWDISAPTTKIVFPYPCVLHVIEINEAFAGGYIDIFDGSIFHKSIGRDGAGANNTYDGFDAELNFNLTVVKQGINTGSITIYFTRTTDNLANKQ